MKKKWIIAVVIYFVMAAVLLLQEYNAPYIRIDVRTSDQNVTHYSLSVYTEDDAKTMKSVVLTGEAEFFISGKYRNIKKMVFETEEGQCDIQDIRVYGFGVEGFHINTSEASSIVDGNNLIQESDGSLVVGEGVLQNIRGVFESDRGVKLLMLGIGTAIYLLIMLTVWYFLYCYQKEKQSFVPHLKKVFWDNRYFWGVCLIFTLIYLWWYKQIPQYGTTELPHDDTLFVKWVSNLIQGNWLGEYGSKTLIKRPLYSVFVALCNGMGISVMLALGLFNVFAACICILAFRKVICNRIFKTCLYFYLLLSPVMYNFSYTQRTYRMSIIPPLVILIISALAGLFFRRKENIRNMIPWTVLSGLSVGVFWNVREDSVWMLPFIGGASICLLIALIVENGKDKKKLVLKIALISFPALSILLSNGIIKKINQYHYGVATISEIDNSSFGEMMNLIYSVKQDKEIEYVQVNHDTVERLCEVSPTLNSIKKEIDWIYDSDWQLWGTGADDGEIEGGYFLWAIRDAVEQAGYYGSAVSAERFYEKVVNELKTGFETGELQKQDRYVSSSLINRWKDYYPSLLADKISETVKWLVNYEKIELRNMPGYGDEDGLREIEAIYGSPVGRENRQKLSLQGWGFPVNSADDLQLVLVADGSEAYYIENSGGDIDIYQYFKSQGMTYEGAKECRFTTEFEAKTMDSLELLVYVSGVLEKSYNLKDKDNIGHIIYEDSFIISLDKAEVTAISDPVLMRGEKPLRLFGAMTEIYSRTGLMLAVLGCASFLGLVICFFIDKKERKKTQIGAVVLVLLGILVSLCALAIGVSYTYIEAWNTDERMTYMAGAYPVMQLFIGISVLYLLQYIMQRRKGREAKDEIDHSNPLL